jgi:hypothetical protein
MPNCVIIPSCDSENDIPEKTYKLLPLTTMKSVHWKLTCSQVLVEHTDDMSDDEIRSIWYDEEDYRTFKKDCKSAAKLVRAGGNSESSICTRGLEVIACTRRAALRRMRRENAWDSVLFEQQEQLESGTHSPESIVQLYQDLSEPCQRDANLLGLQYQEEELSSERRTSEEALSKGKRRFTGLLRTFSKRL